MKQAQPALPSFKKIPEAKLRRYGSTAEGQSGDSRQSLKAGNSAQQARGTMGRDSAFLKFPYKPGGREKDVAGEGDKMMKDLVPRKRSKP